MRKKALLILCGLFAVLTQLTAQTTYLQLGHEDYQLLDRLETKSGRLSNDLYLSTKPVGRKGAVSFLEYVRDSGQGNISNIDRYNIDHMISVSGEWAKDGDGAINSKRPWSKNFYSKQPDLVHVNTDNFFLSANPVLSAIGINDQGNNMNPLFTSNRGLEARGMIAKKIGFYTYFTDNQETPPGFAKAWSDSFDAVPGADFYTARKAGKYDYLLARGYIDLQAVKNHVNVTLGYDRHSFGDGMRSLFLSEFAGGAAFLRLNTRIWRLNYQNLYLELTPQHRRGSNDRLPHKYATMHHLSVNATRWLNVGLFEAVVFNRVDRYEFSYMNPIILYRQTERSLGSPDNVLLGLNAKAIIAKRIQLYGQFVLDEFTSKELFAGKGYWANKFGLQGGAKYFDAFSVKNLDLQGEINVVRPFTYSHFDSIANYSHNNQPLAHPLGAGFAEITGRISYQPVKNLFLSMKGMYYQQGADTGGSNFGSNILSDYDSRSMTQTGNNTYGYTLISGVKTQCALLNFNATYELRENLNIDLGVTHRRFAYENAVLPTIVTTYIYGGLRLNLVRRDYDFY